MKINEVTTREGYKLIIKTHEKRSRIIVEDSWSGEKFQFELGDIAAQIVGKQLIEGKDQ